MSAAPPPPLSAADVLRMAKFYLARRAASTLQLRRFLLRKIGLLHSRDPDAAHADRETIEALVEDVLGRVGGAGLLDDAALALARASGLTGKGLPAERMRRMLARQGFDPHESALEEALHVDDEAQARRYAERKRLGPYASGRRTASPERDIRALVRAGFRPAIAARIIQMPPETGPPTSPEEA